MEYDLVYLNRDMLFWGARNIDGRGFDTEENRSTRLRPCATMKGSKPSAQAAQDVDGRDVGVALGAAGVLARREDRRRAACASGLRSAGVSLRRTRVLLAKRVASVGAS